MRISTAYRFDYFSSTVSNSSAAMFDAQQKISTGKQISSPADDPTGTSLSVRARDIRTTLSQYSSNISNAKLMLGTSDNTLSSFTNMLNSAKTLALRGANGTNSADSMAALGSSVTQMMSTIVNLGNTQTADGQYIFAGQNTQTAPFSVTNGQISYSGDSNSIKTEVAPGTTIAPNTDASKLIPDIYKALQDLQSNLSSNNPGAISNTSLKTLDDLIQRVNLARGDIGSKTQTLTSLSDQHQRRSDELSQAISNVEDIDMTKAISDYQQANTAYQAALTVSSQGSKLSLMDFMN